jgi:hypothetical protein
MTRSIGELGFSMAKKKEQPRLRHGCSEREKIRLIGDPAILWCWEILPP